MSKEKDLFRAIRTANDSDFYRLIEDADLSYTDEHGRTAMHIAASLRNADYLEALLDKGAPVDAKDENASTPLYLAAEIVLCEGFALDDNFEDTVELLIQHGADKTALDDKYLDGLTINEDGTNDDITLAILQRIREFAATVSIAKAPPPSAAEGVSKEEEEEESVAAAKDKTVEEREASASEESGTETASLSDNQEIRIIESENRLDMRSRNESDVIFVISIPWQNEDNKTHITEYEEYLHALEEIKKDLEESQYATMKLDHQEYYPHIDLDVVSYSCDSKHDQLLPGEQIYFPEAVTFF